MSVPKKKLSKRRVRARRSHHRVEVPNLVKCKDCPELVQPHHACTECGKYQGRDVMQKEAKAQAAVAKQVAKAKKADEPKAEADEEALSESDK